MKKPSLSNARRSKVFFVDGSLQRGASPHATLCRFAAIMGIATFVPATSTGVTLSVSNAYGTAVPAPGDHAFTSGTSIVCCVTDSPTSLESGTQRVHNQRESTSVADRPHANDHVTFYGM